MSDHLWLIGMMGSGKSTVGAIVARRRELPFHDTDAAVSEATNATVDQIWRNGGEAAFRTLESAEVKTHAGGSSSVVATGGGVVLDPANVAIMRDSGFVVWLTAATEVLLERLSGGGGRPLLAGTDPGAALEAILEARRDLYAVAAHATVATDTLDVEAVADLVEAAWSG